MCLCFLILEGVGTYVCICWIFDINSYQSRIEVAPFEALCIDDVYH